MNRPRKLFNGVRRARDRAREVRADDTNAAFCYK